MCRIQAMDVFNCPHCTAPLPIVPARAGRRALCPKCKLSVDVPKLRQPLPSDDYALAEDTTNIV